MKKFKKIVVAFSFLIIAILVISQPVSAKTKKMILVKGETRVIKTKEKNKNIKKSNKNIRVEQKGETVKITGKTPGTTRMKINKVSYTVKVIDRPAPKFDMGVFIDFIKNTKDIPMSFVEGAEEFDVDASSGSQAYWLFHSENFSRQSMTEKVEEWLKDIGGRVVKKVYTDGVTYQATLSNKRKMYVYCKDGYTFTLIDKNFSIVNDLISTIEK